MNTKELIHVFAGSIQNEQVQLVDARALHRFLEVDTHFKDWIARRIEEYGFTQENDYVLVAQNRAIKGRGGDRRSKDYHLTLDMAKELSMVERNEKGRQARRYFIECEKRLHQIAPQEAATIMGKTIGTDGFHVLGALIKGKVRALPAPGRRRATMKLWSQVHAAFNVRTAEDIPSAQLDSARNFIGAYALEGELLNREEAGAASIAPPVWTRPALAGAEDGPARNIFLTRKVVGELKQWTNEQPFGADTQRALWDALDDLNGLLTSCWTHIDEALLRINSGMNILHRWQPYTTAPAPKAERLHS